MKNMIICLYKRTEDENESKGHIEKKCFLAYGSLHVFGNHIMQCCFWYQYCGRFGLYFLLNSEGEMPFTILNVSPK